jgi:hypothetical protein
MSRSAAIHEAGHTVVARTTRFVTPLAVRVNQNGTGRLEASLSTPKKPGPIEHIREYLTVTLAGVIAERCAAGEPPLGQGPLGEETLRILATEPAPWRDDSVTEFEPTAYDWAIAELDAAYKDEPLARGLIGVMLPTCMRNAVRIVRENWDELEELAARLDTDGEIDFQENSE